MTTEDLIRAIFCEIDGRMLGIAKHPQAKLWPSELVTIGVLAALKGGHFRVFYRWLKGDYDGRSDRFYIRPKVGMHPSGKRC
ncbi:MAG: hypothetical protein ACYDBJ_14485 [Aggregatilineales bacterium]